MSRRLKGVHWKSLLLRCAREYDVIKSGILWRLSNRLRRACVGNTVWRVREERLPEGVRHVIRNLVFGYICEGVDNTYSGEEKYGSECQGV